MDSLIRSLGNGGKPRSVRPQQHPSQKITWPNTAASDQRFAALQSRLQTAGLRVQRLHWFPTCIHRHQAGNWLTKLKPAYAGL